jgi:hypothetical protein
MNLHVKSPHTHLRAAAIIARPVQTLSCSAHSFFRHYAFKGRMVLRQSFMYKLSSWNPGYSNQIRRRRSLRRIASVVISSWSKIAEVRQLRKQRTMQKRRKRCGGLSSGNAPRPSQQPGLHAHGRFTPDAGCSQMADEALKGAERMGPIT